MKKTRIPRVRARIGATQDIFRHKSQDTTRFDIDNLAKDVALDQGNNYNAEYRSGVGVFTIKGSTNLENTKLNTGSESSNLLYDQGKVYNANNGIPEDGKHESTWYVPATKVNFLYLDDDNSNAVNMVNAPVTGSWQEGIPTGQNSKPIRLYQLKAKSGIATKLRSVNKFRENPNLIFEFEKKPNPDVILENTLPVVVKYDKVSGTQLPTKDNETIKTKDSNIYIGIGNSDSETTSTDYTEALGLTFQDGRPPFAFMANNCYAEYATPITIPSSGVFRITIRCFKDCIEVTSDELLGKGNIWLIQSQYRDTDGNIRNGELRLLESDVDIHTYNIGVMNFGFAQVRFRPTINLTPKQFVKKYTDVDQWSSQIRLPVEKLKDVLASNATVNAVVTNYLEPHTSFSLFLEKTIETSSDGNTSGITSVQPVLWMHTLDDLYTPYIKKVAIDSPNKFTAPAVPSDVYTDYHIKNLNINSSLQGLKKITRSGTITFTNIKTVNGTSVLNDTIDWSQMPIQQAIYLEFAWDYASETSSDDDLVWNPLFSGYMHDPVIQNGNYGESTITYQLSDRWHQLEDKLIQNSKFYDGVSWETCVRDLLNMSLIADEDIEISDSLLKINDGPVLSIKPGVENSPQFKWKTGTKIDACIEQTMVYAPKTLLFFSREGKFIAKPLIEIIDFDPVVFRNYISGDDDNVGLAGTLDSPWNKFDDNDLQQPWNSIKNQSFTNKTSSVYNEFITFGGNFDTSKPIQYNVVHSFDKESIYDSSSKRYIGYVKTFIDGSIAYADEASLIIRQKYNKLIYGQPIRSYTFETLGNLLEPGTKIRIYENNTDGLSILTGINDVDSDEEYTPLWITGNTFSYDFGTLKATSNITADYLRGLQKGFLDYTLQKPISTIV